MAEKATKELLDSLLVPLINGANANQPLLLKIRAEVLSCMVKPSPYARCSICSVPLDVPGRPWSLDCGGDCIVCMADAGDPECVEAVAAMRAGEEVVVAAEAVLEPWNCLDSEGGLFCRVSEGALEQLRHALPTENGGRR